MKLIPRVKIVHSFCMLRLNCSTLSFSTCLDSSGGITLLSSNAVATCLDSSTPDRKRIFRNSLLRLGKWPLYYLQSFSTNHESWLEHAAELSSNTYKQFVFCLVVFAATESMPCVHIRDLKLYVSRKFSTYFSLGGMIKLNFKLS